MTGGIGSVDMDAIKGIGVKVVPIVVAAGSDASGREAAVFRIANLNLLCSTADVESIAGIPGKEFLEERIGADAGFNSNDTVFDAVGSIDANAISGIAVDIAEAD